MTAAENLVGRKVDGYTVVRHLKRGGMADVYLARHAGLQRDVAMKVLLDTYLDNTSFVERFQREAQAMARLEHPNIVHVYDTGTLPDGRPYFTMQFVPGGTLEEKLESLAAERKLMTVAYALAIARQVAAALQVAHEHSIIHRDLKPSNILLDTQGKPILTDLGIAFVQDDHRLTRTDIFLGTPQYMSPEQGKGLGLDHRSDIYSLGVVLFELLAGQRPFDGDSQWALIHQHMSEQAPPIGKVRPEVSKVTQVVVGRCLEKEPARRYQSAAELVAALDNALRAERGTDILSSSGQWMVGAGDTSRLVTGRSGQLRTMPAPKPVKQGRGPLLLGGILGVAVLAFAAIFVLNPPREAPPLVGVTPQTIVQVVTVIGTNAAGGNPTSTVRSVAVVEETATLEPTPQTSATALPSRTPAPTATAAPERTGAQSVRVVRDVFTRQGPGMTYPIAGSLARDASVGVIGRDRRGDWYLVTLDNLVSGWVGAQYLSTATGSDLAAVEVAVTIPSLPSPTASATPQPVLPTPTTAASGGGGGGVGTPDLPGPTSQPPTETPTAAPPTPSPTPPCAYPYCP